MKLFKNSDKRIVSSGLAIALGAVIMLFVAMNLSAIGGWIGKLASYMSSVIWGLAIAYLVRPFTKFVARKLPKRIKSQTARDRLGASAALLLMLLIIVLLISIVGPRMVSSIADFFANFDDYLESLKNTVKRVSASLDFINVSEESIDQFVGNSESLIKTGLQWLQSNYERVLSVVSNVASVIVNSIIILTIAVYALFDMKNIKRNVKRVELALFGSDKTLRLNSILRRGDNITTNFLSSNIIDALIIAVINFIFLTLMDAPYALVLSMVLGVTNLVPTFGPVAGGVVAGVIILLTDSPLILPFVIFTLVLQQIDGNILKAVLFGDSTGLSGFWVMVAIVVGGQMFGVIGMVMGVPVVAFVGSILNDLLCKVNGDSDLKPEVKKKRRLSLKYLFRRRKEEG